MSRIPSSTRSPAKPTSSTPAKPQSRSSATTPVRPRTKSSIARPSPQKAAAKDDPPPSAPALSIREAIALKRAEAKKTKEKVGGAALDDFSSLEDALPDAPRTSQVEEDAFGRCITPDPLPSVPSEPPLPPSDPSTQTRRGGKRGDNPAWFEAQDLQNLKAWNNDIVEIQHEITLFGSLKVVDFHKNKLTSLPHSFGDLTALTTLDLSHNNLSSLPTNLFSLPELATLNISHNQLTSLSFNAPFASGRKVQTTSGGFFTPTIVRATTTLPRLVSLDASHNRLLAKSIDLAIPAAVQKVDLSYNPLGVDSAAELIAKLSTLTNLKELRLEHADAGDDAFPRDLTTSSSFTRLVLLDVAETKVTEEAIRAAFAGSRKDISFDLTTETPPDGVLRVLVGKKVVREAWELEMERKAKSRSNRTLDSGIEWGSATPAKGKTSSQPSKEIEKEPWEIEAEQGLLTEGAKRRARAQAAAASTTSRTPVSSMPAKEEKKEVLKEAWEIEAEQGLLTEGGRRRARAAAASATNEKKSDSAALGHGVPTSTSRTISLTHPQYYTESVQTLTLPASAPPTKASGHARAFSMAASSSSAPSLLSKSSSSDLAVPFASVPLAEISSQSFAHSLRVLNLCNRRMDKCFTIPASLHRGSALLPQLEELDLENCAFGDFVAVSRIDLDTDKSSSPPRTNEPIIPLLTSLFPRLQTLNLSYNSLTSAILTTEGMTNLILEAPHRKGLRHLRLRGNRIDELDGFQGIAELFKGNRDVPGWKLEELDLRDNNIGKLPAEMGLLPLDVFLVDGNT
ncbi:hypothetical protein V5O48_003960 [Marasmius crinis-equi]|uniref:L domain-like protein n=1 Tax=Marasmius crinis-equi TaxID=585013 RepID=A0ABR3FRK7_9AGAR